MKRYAIYVFISTFALWALLVFTRPSLDALWVVGLFFALLFIAVYSLTYLTSTYLKVRYQKRMIAGVTSALVTGLQIMMTFRALRLIDIILLSAAIGLVAWYLAKLR